VQLKSLIEERVGGGEGWGGFLRMNPRVDDIPEQFAIDVDGVRVLAMGTIDRGKSGCACPANILLREVLNHLLLGDSERVVVDMEAGIEHFGRATAEGVDAMLVVVEPGWASLETAARVVSLAADLGVKRTYAIANKIACEADLDFVRAHLAALEILGVLPADRDLELEARAGEIDRGRPFHREMLRIAGLLGD
jgi:CO dehydrogenase maturation factor